MGVDEKSVPAPCQKICRVGVSVGELEGHDDAGKPREGCVDDVHVQLDLADVDAREPRGFLVAAKGKHLKNQISITVIFVFIALLLRAIFAIWSVA